MYRTRRRLPITFVFVIVVSISSMLAAGDERHGGGGAGQQMDWWGLPDAVATAGKLFEYRLDQLTGDAGDDDDDYGSAEQPRPLTLDVYQVHLDTLVMSSRILQRRS